MAKMDSSCAAILLISTDSPCMFIPGAVEGYNLQVQNQNVMWSIKNEKNYENYVN